MWKQDKDKKNYIFFFPNTSTIYLKFNFLMDGWWSVVSLKRQKSCASMLLSCLRKVINKEFQ